MPANCLTPIIKCAYKKSQQQIKEEAFQDGDFLQKVHQYLSSPDVLENIKKRCRRASTLTLLLGTLIIQALCEFQCKLPLEFKGDSERRQIQFQRNDFTLILPYIRQTTHIVHYNNYYCDHKVRLQPGLHRSVNHPLTCH